jgi:putative copper export protein
LTAGALAVGPDPSSSFDGTRELVRFLHIVAFAIFVGGHIQLIVAIVPGLRGEPDEVMLRVARRFGGVSAVAILLLLATGIAMASHFARWGDSTLRAKLQ